MVQYPCVHRYGIRDVLLDGAELSVWDDVATCCLTCGNCTAVCPTCFCTDVRDTTTLDGAMALRTRHWDSCFSLQFSRIAGHPVRSSVRSRYRQWLTHKLGRGGISSARAGVSAAAAASRGARWASTSRPRPRAARRLAAAGGGEAP